MSSFLNGNRAALEAFAGLSRNIGSRPDYVQGGGGNTSVKLNGGLMAVKASGFCLSDVGADRAYAVLDYDSLRRFYMETDPSTLSDCEKVIENNAACPLTLPEHVDEMIRLLDDYDWVQTTLHLTDALGSVSNRTVNRDDYFLIQAPDAYRFREILACFDPNHPNGHPAVQLPPSARGRNVFRDGQVFKVTHPDDVEIAELMLRRRAKSCVFSGMGPVGPTGMV